MTVDVKKYDHISSVICELEMKGRRCAALTRLSYHRCVVGEGVQVPHVAVDQPPDVLHLRAQVLVRSVGAQHADPANKSQSTRHSGPGGVFPSAG